MPVAGCTSIDEALSNPADELSRSLIEPSHPDVGLSALRGGAKLSQLIEPIHPDVGLSTLRGGAILSQILLRWHA